MRSVELKRLDRIITQLVDVRNNVQIHFDLDLEIEDDLLAVEEAVTPLYNKVEEEVRNA